MTAIAQIYTCPRCEESLTAKEKPKLCPGCGYKFSSSELSGFVDPLTITEQNERINDKAAHSEFVLNLPIDLATNIMQDALNIIETIPGKKVKVADIRILMGLAIRIGQIAKAYEDFLAAGGTHAPGLLITPGESDELSKAKDGGSATTSKPTPLFLSVEQNGRSGDDII